MFESLEHANQTVLSYTGVLTLSLLFQVSKFPTPRQLMLRPEEDVVKRLLVHSSSHFLGVLTFNFLQTSE